MPPPSRESRYSLVVLTGFGSPPCLSVVSCSIVVAAFGVVLTPGLVSFVSELMIR
jgi:hypothetical protein